MLRPGRIDQSRSDGPFSFAAPRKKFKNVSSALQQPVEAKTEDGWTVQSASVNGPSAEELKAQISDQPPPAKAGEPPPAAAAPAASDEPPTPGRGEEIPPTPAVAANGDQPVEAPKKRRNPQERIDEAIGRQRQAEDKLLLETAEKDRLVRELETLKGTPTAVPSADGKVVVPPAAAAVPAAAAPPVTAERQPKPVWGGPNGYEARGETWDKYNEDRDAWHEAELAAVRSEIDNKIAFDRTERERLAKETRESVELETAKRAHAAKLQATRDRYPDFNQVTARIEHLRAPYLAELIIRTDIGGDIAYQLGQHVEEAEVLASIQPTRPVIEALRLSSGLPKLLSHFAQHPDELRRLNTLSEVAAVLELGRLSERLAVAPSATTAAVPSITNAKPPTRPVGGAPIARETQAASSEMDFGPEYVQAENRAEAQARSRRL